MAVVIIFSLVAFLVSLTLHIGAVLGVVRAVAHPAKAIDQAIATAIHR